MYTFNHLTNVGLQEVKFKTTIEISSEAENKNEAMEIVGEYLAGYLSSGVDMPSLPPGLRIRYHSFNAFTGLA